MGMPMADRDRQLRFEWVTPTVAITRGFDQRDVTLTDGMGTRADGVQGNLNEQVAALTLNTGPRRLNPMFVEWLMAFPARWTEL
jgi:hypothetical protein